LRLAEIGDVGGVPEPLYELREHTGSISSRRRTIQGAFAELARDCASARKEGRSEAPALAAAEALRESVLSLPPAGIVSRHLAAATTLRLVAARLREKGDSAAARTYLLHALKEAPFHPGAWWDWIKVVASKARFGGRRPFVSGSGKGRDRQP
jgi:hypothetical protein